MKRGRAAVLVARRLVLDIIDGMGEVALRDDVHDVFDNLDGPWEQLKDEQR